MTHDARCSTGCGCDPLAAVEPTVHNPPGQPSLRWRVAPHSQVLARLRSHLGEGEQPPDVRALAGNGTDDPAVAMLDAFATVADTVSFYTERLAQEGFLGTATDLDSVRLLARTIGYELRPGVAAEVELAFDVEDAPGAPSEVDVAAGTAAQSIPGKDELPQVFETSADLHAAAAWNAIGAASVPVSYTGVLPDLFGEGEGPPASRPCRCSATPRCGCTAPRWGCAPATCCSSWARPGGGSGARPTTSAAARASGGTTSVGSSAPSPG